MQPGVRGLALLLPLLLVGLLFPMTQGQAQVSADGVHLTWRRDPMTTMTLTWLGPPGEYHWVAYGGTPEADEALVPGTSRPRAPGDRLLWTAELTGLEPGTRYYYRVGAPGRWTPVASFVTAPARWSPTTFAAVADVGTRGAAPLTPGRLASLGPDLVLLAGDLAYAEGDPRGWDRWFSMMEPVGRQAPLMAVPGNHEDEPGSLGAYTSRLPLPGMPGRLYYSFNYSNIHFVGLDTHFHDYPSRAAWDGAQDAWLEADLARASRDPFHPWVVVYLHVPLFSNGRVYSSWKLGRATWGALFDRYHVDLVISGHSHDYERTYPVDHGATVIEGGSEELYPSPRFPVYVVTGGGGAGLLGFEDVYLRVPENETGNGTADATRRIVNLAPWSAVRDDDHEVLKVRVDGGTMEVWALETVDGSILDHFAIVKGAPEPPGGLPRERPLPAPAPAPPPRGREGEGIGTAEAAAQGGGLPPGLLALPAPRALPSPGRPPPPSPALLAALGALAGVIVVGKVLYRPRRSGRRGGRFGPGPRR